MTSLNNTRQKYSRHPIIIGLIVLAVIVTVMTILEVTNTTYFFHKRHLVTAGPTTKGIPSGNTQQNSTSNGGQQSSDSSSSTTDNSKSPSPGSTTSTLLVPQGNFISAHHQSLSENPSINSVCNTTPGAMCEILFTQGSVTKSLPAQLTDKGGATYWNGWHLQDIGITAGTWKITAKATLGSQTQTASDAMDLVVTE